MTERPTRIQLSRAKGWRMPANTVSVARPGKFGNPFIVYPGRTAAQAIAEFRMLLVEMSTERFEEKFGRPLRGKNLACWCKPGAPCHADVLIEMANT